MVWLIRVLNIELSASSAACSHGSKNSLSMTGAAQPSGTLSPPEGSDMQKVWGPKGSEVQTVQGSASSLLPPPVSGSSSDIYHRIFNAFTSDISTSRIGIRISRIWVVTNPIIDYSRANVSPCGFNRFRAGILRIWTWIILLLDLLNPAPSFEFREFFLYIIKNFIARRQQAFSTRTMPPPWAVSA